ncbi:MAG: hypothetical protein QOJ72_2940 [Nocardioidaceae bacterium]|nr:hypothetical protein [Nocardioidaceae bacterium]
MTVIRLMSDYMASWPVWDHGGLTDQDEWEAILSPGLHCRLIDWQAYFEAYFDHRSGWTAGSPDKYRSEGEALAADLAKELGPGHEVRLDLWPIH